MRKVHGITTSRTEVAERSTRTGLSRPAYVRQAEVVVVSPEPREGSDPNEVPPWEDPDGLGVVRLSDVTPERGRVAMAWSHPTRKADDIGRRSKDRKIHSRT